MDLVFRESDHTYWLGGEQIPGVTTILKPVTGYDGIPKWILDKAAERGTAVHYVTELHDLGTLDYASVDDELIPYLTAYMAFLDAVKPKIITVESRVFHPVLKYAGTEDREMVINGFLSSLDIKTCAEMQASTGPQTAAYMEAKNHGRSAADKIKRRYGLQLKKDGRYELHQYKDATDFNTFTSCLNVWRFNQRHK